MSTLARRYILVVVIVCALYALYGSYFTPSGLPDIHPESIYQFWPGSKKPQASANPLVRGPPTESFRDNLRNDTKYITSWISAGWMNDVITYANLIYLGHITGRVPVVPIFIPSHIGGDAPSIRFGEVFDVPRFVKDSGIPLVEWHEVKDPASEAVDELGCWNVWEAVQTYEHQPRYSWVTDHLGLEVSYTRAPAWVKMTDDANDLTANIWSLARLTFPEQRPHDIGHPVPSEEHHVSLDPDDHLLCFDYLYYTAVAPGVQHEIEHDYSPVWRDVARHLRWTPRLEALAEEYVKRTFDLPQTAAVPPYVAVHVRRGDFSNWCAEAEDPADCFAPLSVIERRVNEVRAELLLHKNLTVPATRVLVTSDETDAAWWADVRARGWRGIDHAAARTAARLGRWYPVLVDAAALARADGFVGTAGSTYSSLSARRVREWRGGAVRMYEWGRKGADDH